MTSSFVFKQKCRRAPHFCPPPLQAYAQARLVHTLRDNGGKLVDEGVGDLATQIGGRKPTVHNALVGLLAAVTAARVGSALMQGA
jgi:hypothetical protein